MELKKSQHKVHFILEMYLKYLYVDIFLLWLSGKVEIFSVPSQQLGNFFFLDKTTVILQ